MGWSWQYRPRGQSHAEFFGEGLVEGAKLLKTYQHERKVVFAVMEYTPAWRAEKGLGPIRIMEVFLIRWANSYYNFGYKPMSEFSGPGVVGCPNSMLDMLSPIEDITENPDSDSAGWARAWRERARQYNRENVRPSLKTGGYYKLRKPLSFGYVGDVEHIKVTHARRRKAVTFLSNHNWLKLDNWCLNGAVEITEEEYNQAKERWANAIRQSYGV